MKRNIVLVTFERLRHRLHTAACNIAGQDNADDVLQDAFIKLWSLNNLTDSQEQTAKITSTIVKNTSIDYIRRGNISEEHKNSSCDRTNSKEQEIQEIFDEVKRIIEQQLTETQRQVLWMRDYEGYSFAEIAKTMDITEENTRQILSRARKIVRETYKKLN